jgi:predicted permease
MTAVLSVVTAVFGIIAIGYAAGRTGYLAVAASRGIADFAFTIAIPALLFHTIVTARFDNVAPLGVLLSFYGAIVVVWAASLAVTAWVLRRPREDQPSVAMAATFGNTVMLGLPIGASALGQDALAPISAIIACHSPLLLLSATLHSAVVGSKTGDPATPGILPAMAGVARQLAHQPIVVALVAAGIVRLTGLSLPGPILTMAEMLSRAGVPAALIALGLSLATFKVEGDLRTVSALLVLKLLLMPLLAWAFAIGLALPPVSASAVVLMAALPAGANAYLFAQQNNRAVNAVSGAVAIGTALSAVTLTLVLIGLRLVLPL